MPAPPSCKRLGRQCRELAVTVRIADLDDDTRTEQDAAATWLLGHTERITFGKPYVRGRELYADAVVAVPCKYLEEKQHGTRTNGRPQARCGAHGFRGPLPRASKLELKTLRYDEDRFTVVQDRRLRTLPLPVKGAARRSLPVLQAPNPCDGAPCRTADNRVGAACCRDLTLEIALTKGQHLLEALLRSRKSPYLCKVKRTDERSVECEVISACGYLGDDRISCTLHNRVRPNGRPAKPGICSDWPEFEDDDEYTGHPGCVLIDD